jgi:hypothetical protein
MHSGLASQHQGWFHFDTRAHGRVIFTAGGLQEDVTACVEALKEQYGPDFLEPLPEDSSQGGWGPGHPVAAAAATLSSSLTSCELWEAAIGVVPTLAPTSAHHAGAGVVQSQGVSSMHSESKAW